MAREYLFLAYIIDMNAIIRYIIKYTTKSEKTSSSYMDFIYKMNSDKTKNNEAKSMITKLIISSINKRDYSAQEVAHIMMSWPLYVTSREFRSLCLFENQYIKIKLFYFV